MLPIGANDGPARVRFAVRRLAATPLLETASGVR